MLYVTSIGSLGLHTHIVITKKFDNSGNYRIHILYHQVRTQSHDYYLPTFIFCIGGYEPTEDPDASGRLFVSHVIQ